MTRPRILHCIPGMGGGGAERQLAYLARGLTRLGWEVHVALVSPGPNLTRLQGTGAIIHRLTASGNYDPRLLWKLWRTAGGIEPDLIQVWLLQMEILGAIVAEMRRIPWVFSERSSALAYPPGLKTWLRTLSAKAASALVSNSPEGDRYWQACLDPRVSRYTIPNAVPTADIDNTPVADSAELGLTADQRVVLFVGRLSAEKNIDTLLQALRGVIGQPDVVAVLAGEGPERSAIERRLVELRLADRVRVTGYLENVWGWMKRADVFVSPALFEGNPNAVLEAMACGCPIVVSDIPAHRAFLDDEDAALVDPRDVGRLAEAVLNVLSDPAAASHRAEHAQRQVQRWSIDHIAGQYDQVYRTILHAAV